MHWMTTKDLINTPTRTHLNLKTEDVQAYREATLKERAALKAAYAKTMTHEFQLFDDDDELYFEGRCKDLDQMDDTEAFQPLDWAMANYGCTYMKTRKIGEKKWEHL